LITGLFLEKVKPASSRDVSLSRSLRKQVYFDDSCGETVEKEKGVQYQSFNSFMSTSKLPNMSSFTRSLNESMMDNSILASKSFGNSSFYEGKTVFGGHSSKKMLNLPAPISYKRASKKMKVNDTMEGTSATPTKAAKVILKALENTGSEPSVVKDQKWNLLNPAGYLRKSLEPNNQQASASTPPLASLTKFIGTKEKIRSTALLTPRSPTSPIQLHSKQVHKTPSAAGGKMKKERSHYSHQVNEYNANDIYANLHNVALPLPSNKDIKLNLSPIAKNNGSFVFCLPSYPTSIQFSESVPETAEQFVFSVPTAITSREKDHFAATSDSTPVQADQSRKFDSGWGNLLKNQQKQWGCPSCLIKNNDTLSKCVACGEAKPEAMSSVDAKKPTNTSTPSSGSGWGNLLKSQQKQWGCPSCLIKNNDTVSKCVACGEAKPGAVSAVEAKKPPSTSTPSSGSGWGNLLKNQQKQWGCPSCLIKNNDTLSKCVACGEAKPGAVSAVEAKKPPSTSTPSSGSGWGNLLKSQQKQWGCPSCLIKNNDALSKCVACGEAKPGAKSPVATSQSPKPPNSSNSNTNLTNIFKFNSNELASSSSAGWTNLFQNQKTQWSCSICLLKNDQIQSKCVSCGSAKQSNVVPNTNSAHSNVLNFNQSQKLVDMNSRSHPFNLWNCPSTSCGALNSVDRVTCQVCGTVNPKGNAAGMLGQDN